MQSLRTLRSYQGEGPLHPECSDQRAFTLIELMIVVVIMAIISGLILPVLFNRIDKAERKRRGDGDTVESEPAPGTRLRLRGRPPVIDALDLRLKLSSSYHRIGMGVFTRYQLLASGSITFRSPDPAGPRVSTQETSPSGLIEGTNPEPVLLFLPFPRNILEARDVELHLKALGTGDKIPAEVQFVRDGIYCRCSPPPGEPIVAAIAFTAFGRERLEMHLPPARRLGETNIVLDLAGVKTLYVPDDSLQPTQTDLPRLTWNIRNLVSERPIVVEIPGAQSPMALVLLLLRYMAVAVLFFGAGFWYLSELAQPGRLDTFRWGHFLLLALTYSLFFAIFSVLEFHALCSTAMSMVISTLFSLPLVILVVKRNLGPDFALNRVTPLVLFSLGIVVTGVYAGPWRDFIFIGAVILLVAFVTLTYETWSEARRKHWAEECQTYRDKRRTLMGLAATTIGQIMGTIGAIDLETAAQSARQRGAVGMTRHLAIERGRAEIVGLRKACEKLQGRLNYVPTELDWLMEDPFPEITHSLEDLREEAEKTLHHLTEELAEIGKNATTAGPGVEAASQHCMACGSGLRQTPFCPSCGAAAATAHACPACAVVTVIPSHCLARRRKQPDLHCRSCGHLLRHGKIGGESPAPLGKKVETD